MLDERESRRSDKASARNSRGPRAKPSRDAPMLEKRSQLLRLHRRRNQLLERLAMEQRQFTALKEQVESLSKRWQDTCASNQQLHRNNLDLHEQVTLAARAQGIEVRNSSNPPLPHAACGVARPNPVTAALPLAGSPAMSGHPSRSGRSCFIGLPPQPPSAAASGSLRRHPSSTQVHSLSLSSSSHGSPVPCAPPMHGLSRAESALAWRPPQHRLAPAPACPAAAATAAAAPGPAVLGIHSSGRCNSDIGPTTAAGPGWGDAYSRACSWGSSQQTPSPLHESMEAAGSSTQLGLMQGSPQPVTLSPNAPAAAPDGVFNRRWGAALGAPGAPVDGGSLACTPGGPYGIARSLLGQCASSDTWNLQQQQQAWVVYDSHCIARQAPGWADLPALTDPQPQLLEPPTASATVTRVCKPPPGVSCSGAEHTLAPSTPPGDSQMMCTAGMGGSPVAACGGQLLQPPFNSWPSSSSIMSGSTMLLGQHSPLTSPTAVAGGCASAGQLLLLPTAAAGVDVGMDVAPEEVEQLLDSLLEQDDPLWLDVVGGEEVLV